VYAVTLPGAATRCPIAEVDWAGPLLRGPARLASTQAAARSDSVLMKDSKSALIWFACVVGIPCGSPG